jgi:hypothetical protein
MLPPRDWIEKWAYVHPWKALAICLFGIVMMTLTTWLVVTGP